MVRNGEKKVAHLWQERKILNNIAYILDLLSMEEPIKISTVQKLKLKIIDIAKQNCSRITIL